MPLLGQRAQGFRKDGKSFHADGRLTGLRDEAIALHSDPVTDVQLFENGKCRFANFLGVNKDLQAAGKVGDVEKSAFPHVAMRGDSPGGAHRA